MIAMEMFGKIRSVHVRDKVSVRAKTKRTGLSRNTLQKWLQTPEEVNVPQYVRAKGFGKLGAFADELEQAYTSTRRSSRWSAWWSHRMDGKGDRYEESLF